MDIPHAYFNTGQGCTKTQLVFLPKLCSAHQPIFTLLEHSLGDLLFLKYVELFMVQKMWQSLLKGKYKIMKYQAV